MMRVVSLGSGSSGNALLVEAGPQRRTKLLVDAGFSGRILFERLCKVGVHPSQLQGVLVTHEHSDHVLGLPLLMKRYHIPVITDPRTYAVIEQGLVSGMWRTDSGVLVAQSQGEVSHSLGATQTESMHLEVSDSSGELITCTMNKVEQCQGKETAQYSLPLSVGESCTIGDIAVTSFSISHDAIAPCGYLLSTGGCRVCLVTDTGEVTETMLAAMQQADLLILESNHDRERLLRGPYPRSLKERILSTTGHLSNEQAAEAVLRTWRADGLRWLWLAHLSRTNNTPSLALKSVRASLQAANAPLAQIHITVSPPGMGQVWDSTQLWQCSTLWEMEH